MTDRKFSSTDNNEFFESIQNALIEGIDDLKAGKKLTVRTAALPDPPPELAPKDIISLREKLKLSQQVFANLLNASVKTIQAWEQGRKKPSGPSLRLLQIARNYPEALISKQ